MLFRPIATENVRSQPAEKMTSSIPRSCDSVSLELIYDICGIAMADPKVLEVCVTIMSLAVAIGRLLEQKWCGCHFLAISLILDSIHIKNYVTVVYDERPQHIQGPNCFAEEFRLFCRNPKDRGEAWSHVISFIGHSDRGGP